MQHLSLSWSRRWILAKSLLLASSEFWLRLKYLKSKCTASSLWKFRLSGTWHQQKLCSMSHWTENPFQINHIASPPCGLQCDLTCSQCRWEAVGPLFLDVFHWNHTFVQTLEDEVSSPFLVLLTFAPVCRKHLSLRVTTHFPGAMWCTDSLHSWDTPRSDEPSSSKELNSLLLTLMKKKETKRFVRLFHDARTPCKTAWALSSSLHMPTWCDFRGNWERSFCWCV